MPADVRAVVEPALTRHLHRVPAWLDRLYVRLDVSDTNEAEITTRPEYRFATLRIMAGWLSLSEAERHRNIRHELAHIPLEPMCDAFRDLLDALAPEDDEPRAPLRAWALEQWRRAIEGAVCDVARIGATVYPETPAHTEFPHAP
jgi:hypothetical protein